MARSERMTPALGTVISVHELGATVRLNDGRLAAVTREELAPRRAWYDAAARGRLPQPFVVVRSEPRLVVSLLEGLEPLAPTSAAPGIVDAAFEAKVTAYLRESDERTPSRTLEAVARDASRRRKRASRFEARRDGS